MKTFNKFNLLSNNFKSNNIQYMPADDDAIDHNLAGMHPHALDTISADFSDPLFNLETFKAGFASVTISDAVSIVDGELKIASDDENGYVDLEPNASVARGKIAYRMIARVIDGDTSQYWCYPGGSANYIEPYFSSSWTIGGTDEPDLIVAPNFAKFNSSRKSLVLYVDNDDPIKAQLWIDGKLVRRNFATAGLFGDGLTILYNWFEADGKDLFIERFEWIDRDLHPYPYKKLELNARTTTVDSVIMDESPDAVLSVPKQYTASAHRDLVKLTGEIVSSVDISNLIEWSCTNGSISSSGVFTGEAYGNSFITAAIGDVSQTIFFDVNDGAINKLDYSESFSFWLTGGAFNNYTVATITDNFAANPIDGEMTASRMQHSGADNSGREFIIADSVIPLINYVGSVYVRWRGTGSQSFSLELRDNRTGSPVGGTTMGSISVAVDGTWQRVSCFGRTGNDATQISFGVVNGTGGTLNQDLEIYGAMVSAGRTPIDYQGTFGTPI